MTYRTARPVTFNHDMRTGQFVLDESGYVLPAGVDVELVKEADGLTGDKFAAARPRDIVDALGGGFNMHDATHRYLFLPADAVVRADGTPAADDLNAPGRPAGARRLNHNPKPPGWTIRESAGRFFAYDGGVERGPNEGFSDWGLAWSHARKLATREGWNPDTPEIAAPPVLISDDVAAVCGFVDGFTSGGSEAFDSEEAQEAMAEAVQRLNNAPTVSRADLAAIIDHIQGTMHGDDGLAEIAERLAAALRA